MAAIEAAAYRLSAATARLEAVVAQLLAATQQLVTPSPARVSGVRPKPLHGCCKRAARPGTYYTLRPAIVARRNARRWMLPEA